ncbi:MAG: hypothetical protein FWG61_01460, partial [Firmicutes bacterium]|nr:hypothetical protein [Bacillota bacterium]
MKKLLWIGLLFALILVAVPFFSAAAIDNMPVPLDPQTWALNRDRSWSDYHPNPVIDWMKELNPESIVRPAVLPNNTAKTPIQGGLVLIEYLDRKFISRGQVGSDPLGYYLFDAENGSGIETSISTNPIMSATQIVADEKYNGDTTKVTDKDFAQWWADFLNIPQELNRYTTIDEYWRELSFGKWAVDLTPFGPFTIPYFEFETIGYDQSSSFQTYRDVPPSFRRGAAGTTNMWTFDSIAIPFARDNGVAFSNLDFFFMLHAGYDESGVWQEFGMSQFSTRKDIPYELGPGPRMAKVEQFFTANPEWLTTYAARYAGSNPGAAFWANELAKYNTLKAANTPELYEFHLQQADWDWVRDYNDQTQRNTRYVAFTAWEAAVGEWSHMSTASAANTGAGRTIRYSTQGENDSMGTFAHEFGHIAELPDNYGSPWVDTRSPLTEPWDVMSRGGMGGPGDDHTRWSVPGVFAGTIPVHEMLRNKLVSKYYDAAVTNFSNTITANGAKGNDLLEIRVADLASSTPVVARVVGRNIPLNNKGYYPQLDQYGLYSPNFYKGIHLTFETATTSPYADKAPRQTTGWSWTPTTAARWMAVEVIDRTGYDSFAPDHGVILSRISNESAGTGNGSSWNVIDSHLEDIRLIDYIVPGKDGAADDYVAYTLGHHNQLWDAAFHAGKSLVDTGYYKTIYDPADPRYNENTPRFYDNSFNLQWKKDMLQPGSIYRGENPNGRDIASGNTVNEWHDPYNNLHFYILAYNKHDGRTLPGKSEAEQFISYTIGVRHGAGTAVGGELEVAIADIERETPHNVAVTTFAITNTGNATDIIRVGVEGYLNPLLLNDLYAIEAGETITVPVYIELPGDIRTKDLSGKTITLNVSSETNGEKKGEASVLASDLINYNYQAYLLPDQSDLYAGETVYVDLMLSGDLNYTQISAEIAYDSTLWQYAGFTDLAGIVAAVDPQTGKIAVRSIPSLNMVFGETCAPEVKIVTLKFTALGNFTENQISTAINFVSIIVNPPAGFIGAGTAPGKDLPLTIYDTAFTKGMYNNMKLYPNWVVDENTQPIFTYADAIKEIVYIELPCDSDRDGLRDRITAWIMRPNTKEGFLCPVMLEHSSYHNGTVGWSNVSGLNIGDDMKAPFRYKDNWPISKDLSLPIFNDSTHLTYDDIKYSGTDAWNWPWDNSNAFTIDSWYSGVTPGTVPAATVPSGVAKAPGFSYGTDMFSTNPIFNGAASSSPTYYRYYLPRGYALILSQLLGNRDSDGITGCSNVEETLSAMAVAKWLNGEAKAYTTRRGDIEVKADWANGHVAMTGTSYPGILAEAAAVSGVTGLKAVMPQCNISNWYDYYRNSGSVSYPGGYGGEDMYLHASYNFSRWRADLAPGGSTTGYTPSPTGQWFPKSVQDVFYSVQQHMMDEQDTLTGDYNAEWDIRNLPRNAGHIADDCAVLITTALMDWNTKPKGQFLFWQALEDKHNGPHKMFVALSSHASQNNIYIHDKSIMEWWHMWMDRFLLNLDNHVEEALPQVTIANNRTGEMESFESFPIPGIEDQKFYLVPATNGKAGRLSYNQPAASIEHFKDLTIAEQLSAAAPFGFTGSRPPT